MLHGLALVVLIAAPSGRASKKVKPKPVIEVVAPAETTALGELQHLYADAHFERMITEARKQLSAHVFVPADEEKARTLLAFALFFIDAQDESKRELAELFKLNPEVEVNALEHPPQLIEFFRKSKADWIKQQAPTTPAQSRRTFAEFLPFGIGHLVQHDWAFGALYLATGFVMTATNLGCYIYRTRLLQPNGLYASIEPANALQIVQNVAGAMIIAVGVMSVIDAWLLSPGRRQPVLRTSVSALPGGGAGLVLFGYWQ